MVNIQRFKAYGLIVGVFMLGSATGAGVSYAISQRDCQEIASGKREPFERRRLHALTDELDLTSEQGQQIKAIFRKYRDARYQLTREMHDRCGEPLRHHKTRLDAEIRAVLNPDQRARFEELVEEREQRFYGRPRRHR